MRAAAHVLLLAEEEKGSELPLRAGAGWNPALGSFPDAFARFNPGADGGADCGTAKEDRDRAVSCAWGPVLCGGLRDWVHGRQRYLGEFGRGPDGALGWWASAA